ncbi:TPA: hypothetical protein DCY67_04870 [Candidatus Acetothermia bacterium]|nr:hypothetical protein [Candidatus Acetothermia bacterium]
MARDPLSVGRYGLRITDNGPPGFICVLCASAVNAAAKCKIWDQAVRVYGYTLHEVADTLGLHYSTLSVIANQVAKATEAEKHQK